VNLQIKQRLLDLELVPHFSMKKLKIIILLIFCFNSNSFSQIVYIDMNYLLNNSKIGKSLNLHLIEINNQYQEKFNRIEKDLKKKEEDLLSQKNIIEKSEFEKKITDLSKDIQNFRLDNQNNLYDMNDDPSQLKNVSSNYIEIFEAMQKAKSKWQKEVLIDLKNNEKRAFIIGHPSLKYTQIPARDATASGSIKRSNYYPNCSYMTNWVNTEDIIKWEAEVAEAGKFEVVIYYTCAIDAIGSEIELSFEDSKISKKITKYYDPNEYGMENDRVERIESYVKDFIPLNMGTFDLKKGKGTLNLKALKKTGKEVLDFRLLILNRL